MRHSNLIQLEIIFYGICIHFSTKLTLLPDGQETIYSIVYIFQKSAITDPNIFTLEQFKTICLL